MFVCDQTRPVNAEQEVDARLNAQDKLLADAVGTVANTAISWFSEFDRDGNGFLSDAELTGGKELQALTHNSVSSLSNDVWGLESRKGASLNDLRKLEQMSRKVPEEMALARGIRETLSRHPYTKWIHGDIWQREDLRGQTRSGKLDSCDNYYFRKALERFNDIAITHRRRIPAHVTGANYDVIESMRDDYRPVYDVAGKLGFPVWHLFRFKLFREPPSQR